MKAILWLALSMLFAATKLGPSLSARSVPDPGTHLRAGDDGSLVEVAGSSPALYDAQAVPHGVLHSVSYQAKLRTEVRTVVIYTPPDYDKSATSCYPVLYLLHGSGDTEISWTHVGHAHWIAD